MAPQSSIFGPFLFNIYMHDIFMILKTTYFTGNSDDSKPLVPLNKSVKISENGFQITRWTQIPANAIFL